MKHSILDSSGVCVNVIEWDEASDWEPPSNCIVVPGALTVGAAYQYNNQTNKWQSQTAKKSLTKEDFLAQCDYFAFWDALLVSNVYQVIRQQAATILSVNTCCVEFVAAITDAKIGRANPDALQACIWLLMDAVTLTNEEKAELQQLLEKGQLQFAYTLLPPS